MEPIFVNNKAHRMIVAVPSGGQVTLLPGDCLVGAKFGRLATEDILCHISQYQGRLGQLKNPLGIHESQFEFPPKSEETPADISTASVELSETVSAEDESEDYVGDSEPVEEPTDDYVTDDAVFMGKTLSEWAADIETRGDDEVLNELTSANLKDMGQLMDVAVYGNKANSLDILKKEFSKRGWMQ